jgi:hypothetical protein
MRRAVLLVATGAVLVLASAAAACEGQKILYQDHFDGLDPSWGTYGDELTVGNGRMLIRPEAGMVYWQTNDLGSYPDVDVCADVTILESVTADEVLAGLLFWYVDDDNFYALEVDAAGHAAIWKRASGDWREVVPWGDTDLLAIGDGKTDHLRVVARGTTAAAYVNGRELVEVTATVPLPPAGQQVGLIAGSATAGTSTIAFDEFVLTAPK